MLNDGQENVIIDVDGEEVTIDSDYLSRTYQVTIQTGNSIGVSTVGFMHIYNHYRWAIKMLGFSTVIQNGSVTIEVLPASYDAWAYGNKFE